jgi:hypothetical protein
MRYKGANMRTYQDWLEACAHGEDSKRKFITDAISGHMSGRKYNEAVVAREYYSRRNVEIMRRRGAVLSLGELSRLHKKSTRPVNKKCCGFFTKSVNQLSMYLLGNGVSMDANVKKRLGMDFDVTLQRIGRNALIDGICWGFWDYGSVIPFSATEFFGLYDERTSELGAGIRFYQLGPSKPRYIEVFEADGITRYAFYQNEVFLEAHKMPYVRTVRENGGKEVIIGRDNYGKLPVVPFYANDSRDSTLTEGLKNDIDLYDRIMSDFGDNLDRANDIYYVVQNYGGANLKQLIDEIEEYKAIYTDGDSTAQIKTIEAPYQARSAALSLLERQMYKETQTLDTEELTGGGLTNVAIKCAMTELDLKTDMFEWQAEAFMRGILSLAAPDYPEIDISFRRRSLTNDAEMINNIYAMRNDIDLRTALELNPLINENKIDEIMRNHNTRSAGNE